MCIESVLWRSYRLQQWLNSFDNERYDTTIIIIITIIMQVIKTNNKELQLHKQLIGTNGWPLAGQQHHLVGKWLTVILCSEFCKFFQWSLFSLRKFYAFRGIFVIERVIGLDCTGAHRVWRTREHVTPHTRNVNGIIQTWWTFLKTVYSWYSKNSYDQEICNYWFTNMEGLDWLMERKL